MLAKFISAQLKKKFSHRRKFSCAMKKTQSYLFKDHPLNSLDMITFRLKYIKRIKILYKSPGIYMLQNASTISSRNIFHKSIIKATLRVTQSNNSTNEETYCKCKLQELHKKKKKAKLTNSQIIYGWAGVLSE